MNKKKQSKKADMIAKKALSWLQSVTTIESKLKNVEKCRKTV